MSSGLAETAGFETQTPEENQSRGEVDYSLLESKLDESVADFGLPTVAFLREAISNGDPIVRGMALARVPDALIRGVEMGSVPNETMDALRNLWREEMTNEDEDRSYDAQELFYFEQKRLEQFDRTSLVWLGGHVVREWFYD